MSDKPTSVDGYLEIVTEKRREAVTKLRSLIPKTIPLAEESMRYGMPTYDAAGDFLAALASQKQYMSLYMNTEVVAAHADDLSHLNVGKSCIRFTKLEKLPLDVVRVMLKETLEKNQAA
ncbi:MAG: DUF1801 domain-containing protein [Candidatus Promineifilaceae bacterium]